MGARRWENWGSFPGICISSKAARNRQMTLLRVCFAVLLLSAVALANPKSTTINATVDD